MEAATLEVQHGNIAWREYWAIDCDAAADYYNRVFEWEVVMGDRHDGGGSFTMFLAEGIPIGGIVVAEKSSEWSLYVHAPDLEGTMRCAHEIAGCPLILDTWTSHLGGRVGGIYDACSGIVWLLDPDATGPMPKTPPFGSFGWMQLAAWDPYDMFDFYHALFGWEIMDDLDMNAAGDRFLVIGKGSRAFGSIHYSPGEDEAHVWHHYVTVENLVEAFAVAVLEGGRSHIDPVVLPNGDLVAECIDPQGAVFGLRQPAS